MTTRTHERIWTFGKPFMLKGVDRLLPAGSYRVATDEELIEGLSFPVYRRVATMIFVPGQARHAPQESGRRRVAPAWIGVAAAAGLVIGAIGGQAAARFDRAPAAASVTPPSAPASTPTSNEPQTFATATSLLEMDFDAFLPDRLGAINDITPKIQTIASRR